eukprot:gene14709-19769_t
MNIQIYLVIIFYFGLFTLTNCFTQTLKIKQLSVQSSSIAKIFRSKSNCMNILKHEFVQPLQLSITDVQNFIGQTSLMLSDTSISEEEVLDVTGEVSNLPDPLFAVGFAVIIFLGVSFLQFSLGDLTKEEGQARVRDFLQTRKDTERKRGYFD